MKPSLIAVTVCASLALGFTPTPYTPEAAVAAQMPTAQEQSNKKEDIELTRKIREDLMKQETLSLAAKNVNVVTKDGVSHLSGSVKTPEEKDLIESIAKRHAGETKVQSHIQVQA